ncbi:MAG: DUF2066 domain-containing protein [Pseudomonadota bacterium]
MNLPNLRYVSFSMWFATWFLLLSQVPVLANPYSAAVVLEKDTPEQREAAFKDALALVLVKVTGNRNVVGDSSVVDIIDEAPRYVQGFRFEELDQQQMIRVNFDPRAVEQVVSNRGLPVWGSERPSVLLWLAVDNRRGQRFIMSATDNESDEEEDIESRLKDEIRMVADERGLPLMLPLYDAEDQNALSFADVWGGFDEAVEIASQRYQSDAVLVGRARTRGSSWEVRWTLFDANGRQAWVGGFADGIHQTADSYAQAFAVLKTEGEVTLIVDQVTSFQAYGELLSHLRALSVVEQVDLQQALDDTLTFRLRLKGDTDVLQRAIRLGGKLEELSQEVPTQTLGPLALRYQLRP